MKKLIPTFQRALCCILGMVVLVGAGLFVFNVDLRLVMLAAVAWISLNAYAIDSDIYRLTAGLLSSIIKSRSVFLIFMIIGIVIAAFTLSGTLPALIYYSLQLISPQNFLPVAMLLCSVMSLAIGTCWGAIGTMGVALIGVSELLHIPLPLAAGAIVSGAYFGDKFSPLSDTTILSALSADTNLYKHIKGMTYSLIPAYLLSIVIFSLIGHHLQITSSMQIQVAQHTKQLLEKHFYIHWLNILPLFVMFCLSINKKSGRSMALLTATLTALVMAFFVQHATLLQIVTNLLFVVKSKHTGSMIIDTVLSHGGMLSMLQPMSLTVLVLALGGLLESYQFIQVLLNPWIQKLKRPLSLVFATLATAVLCNLLMGEAYLTIILTSRIFKSAYEKLGLDCCTLSKAIEEGSTLSTPLIPWTTSGAFIGATLGITPFHYAAFSLFNWIAPCCFLIFVAMNFFGVKLYKKITEVSYAG